MKKLSLFLIALAMILGSCKPEIEKPTVVTKSVGEITQTTAKIVGQVIADGRAEVTERGVCWSTDGTPTILDFRTVDGTGVGSYTSSLSDLVPQTTYYVRAYATNEAGTSYGDEKTFVTEDPEKPEEPENPEQPEQPEEGAPVVTTAEVTEIKLFSAVCGGEVASNGESVVVARGVCWSIEQNPTIEDSHTTDGVSTGIYTSSLTELNYGTTYYVRAYAINANGITAYGEERIFTTLPIEGTTNGHAWVDLGLPSGKKWATCNVGATSPEEYGDYFAWGETTTKSYYTSSTCPTCGLSESELQSQDYIDSEGNLTQQYDAATANWGGNWRMPTKAEQEELLYNCTWTLTSQNGVIGYKVIGPSGASIFLPAAGGRDGSSLYYAGSNGFYWSSTPDGYLDDIGAYGAYDFYFDSDFPSRNVHYRNLGLSVRSILE